jgi:hypothetical protein
MGSQAVDTASTALSRYEKILLAFLGVWMQKDQNVCVQLNREVAMCACLLAVVEPLCKKSLNASDANLDLNILPYLQLHRANLQEGLESSVGHDEMQPSDL